MGEQRSFWKTLAWWIGGIVLLAIIGHTIMVGGTRRRVAAEIAYIRAKHEPVSPKDLAGPKIPDSKNGAIIYEQVFKMMQTAPLQGYTNDVEPFDPGTTDPKEWARISGSLAGIQPVVDQVAAAQARPKCRFKIEWDKGFAALFPQYAPMRKLARLLSVDAAAKARAGRTEEAVRSLKLVYGLSNAVSEDPILISVLVEIAILAISGNAMQASLDHARITESQAKELFDQLGRIDLSRSYVRAMQGERAMGLTAYDYVQRSRDFLSDGTGRATDPARYIGTYPLRPLLNMDMATYLRLMRSQVDNAGLTILEAKKKGINLFQDPNVPRYAVVTSILFPVFSRARIAADNGRAQLALARVSLAAMAYRARYGSYPASLAEMRSKLRWKLPEDPFSGRDLRYSKTPGGFTVYSFGPNMGDDSGIGSPTAPSDPNAPADIVWEWGL